MVIPIWKGSYERSDGFYPLTSGSDEFREKSIQWVKELRHTVDYLQSRDDIAGDQIGFKGASMGAVMAPLFLALERSTDAIDPIFPVETSQVPLYDLLGSPEGQKRHLVYDAGHSTVGWQTTSFREGLGWLDDLFGVPKRR